MAATTTEGRQPVDGEHPERFDPHGQDGALIASEHRGRYWWASQAVAGKDVLDAGCGVGYGVEILAAAGASSVIGVDIDSGAVDETNRRCGDDTALQGDLRELPLAADSIDVVVCWETIEHMQEGDRAIAEFRRVLRPGGLLLVSSPNPGVYPAGNEHHVYEYRPDELAGAVAEHFPHVARYRQHPWLTSVIEAVDETGGNGAAPGGSAGSGEIRAAAELAPGAEIYGIVAASDVPPPAMRSLVVLGDTFEVGWWSEQLKAAQTAARAEAAAAQESARERAAAEATAQESARERAAAEAAAREHLQTVENDAREHLQTVENDARHALARSAAAETSALERLRVSNAALLEANQALARMPLLQHRMQELHEDNLRLRARAQVVEGSKSWRWTGLLRRLRNPLG